MKIIRIQLKKYLPEFVYGSIDGTITTFAIVAGIAGASLSPLIALILGISNVLADGFSMASSNYLSERTKNENKSKISAFKMALATFISFVIIGFIPIFPFLFSEKIYLKYFGTYNPFFYSTILTLCTFILIGLIRGKINNQNKTITATETFLIGSTAALISYYVGYYLHLILK